MKEKKKYLTPALTCESLSIVDVIMASKPDEDYDVTKSDPGAGYWY